MLMLQNLKDINRRGKKQEWRIYTATAIHKKDAENTQSACITFVNRSF